MSKKKKRPPHDGELVSNGGCMFRWMSLTEAKRRWPTKPSKGKGHGLTIKTIHVYV